MAKFYCRSGSFKVVIAATDEHAAIRKFVSGLKQIELAHTLLVGISEIGFDRCDVTPYSLVPFFREARVNLPPDDCLIECVCRTLGVTHLDERQTDWFINGGN